MICPICNSEKEVKDSFATPNGIVFQMCNTCGLVYRKEIAYFDYTKYYDDDSYRDYMFRETELYSDFEKKILELKRIKPSGKFLDIGCNYGLFLHVAKDYGYEIDGIEPAKSCVAYGKERFGFDIQQGIFDKPTEKKYDIITLNHTLEHVHDPIKVLKDVYRSLENNGIVYVSFPNFGCEEAQKNKSTWKYLMPEGHNFQFTYDTICKCLLQTGFTVIANPDLNDNLSVIARKEVGRVPCVDLIRFEKDHVDIILPVYNNLEYTKTYIEQLYKTADHPFRLIVVNDASTDETKDYLESLNRPNEIEVINNEENLGFLKSVNKGIERGKNDYVLISNNDIRFLQRGWLSTMVNALRVNPDIGAVGIEYLHNAVDFLSMCHFITRRKIIYKIGLLDERYCPGVFEDVDYSTRIQLEGYAISSVKVSVSHLMNSGDQGGKKKEELTEINKKKFIDKYDFINRKNKLVFHVNNQLWCGGIEEDIKNFIKYRKEGWEVIVASPCDGRMSKEMQDYGAKIFIGNFNRIYTLMNLLKPDVVHTHTNGNLSYANSLANAISPKPVRVESIHSPGLSNATPDKVDALVAVSLDTYNRQTYDNTYLIYNGIDFDKCKMSKRLSEDGKIRIGKICRISPDKKIIDFILAAKRLTDKYPGKLEFNLVGEDSGKFFKDSCMKFVKQLEMDNFIFYPETRSMDLLNTWDIGLQPTSAEGFGLVTAEMMAMGMPIVTYDSYANKEIVINGRNGYVVPIDDIDRLVKYTSYLIDYHLIREVMAEKGCEDVKKFDAVQMTQEYYQLYENLLKEKK